MDRLLLVRPHGTGFIHANTKNGRQTAMVQKRLGRGLESLITGHAGIEQHVHRPPQPRESDQRPESPSNEPKVESRDVPSRDATNVQTVRHIPVECLSPNPYQPRKDINAADIAELARSIAATGLLQPIVARGTPEGLQIVAGERRLRAARAAGLATIPVIMREATDEQMLEWALVENIHREDLNAIERASAYRQYCDAFGVNADEVAKRVGEDRSTVANYLRLLELPDAVKQMVVAKQLSMGHARALLGVNDDARRLDLAAQIVARELSVRALEELIRARRREPKSASSAVHERRMSPPHVRDLETRLEEALGTKVRIEQGRSKGSGRVVIDFYSLDDFDRICHVLGVNDGDVHNG